MMIDHVAMRATPGDEENQQTFSILLSNIQKEVNELRYKTENYQQGVNLHVTNIQSQQRDVLDRLLSLEENKPPPLLDILDRIISLEESKSHIRIKLQDLEGGSNDMLEDITQLKQEVFHGGTTNSTAGYSSIRSTNPMAIFQRNVTSHDGLPADTFTLMMTSPIQSRKPWLLGMFTFAFQMILILMIVADQLKESVDSSIFNVPFKVDSVVRACQLFAIIFALLTQHDIISSIRFLVMFWNDACWDRIILKRDENAPAPTSIEWVAHILIPNVLKFFQGILVVFATFVVIVQSDNIIDLLKEFTALMVLSETDNIFFSIAANGYLGSELQRKSVEVRDIKVQNESSLSTSNSSINNPSTSSSSNLDSKDYLRPIILLSIVMALVGSWLNIVAKQVNGTYFHQRYPDCNMTDAFALATEHFGDGKCYGGPLNSLECEFEDGDCINFNLAFPLCKGDNKTDVEDRVGDGQCNTMFMDADCDFDGGDCCPYDIINDPSFGDGQCDGGISSTALCGYDNGDCNQLRISYPKCPFDRLREITGADDLLLGDGMCNSGIYNMKECGYKFGDCKQGQVGQTIFITDDIESNDHLFFSQTFSSDGSTVALGLYFNDQNGFFREEAPGVVKVWRYNNNIKMWLRLGGDVAGLVGEDERFGRHLSISSSGNLIAISSTSGLQVFGYNDTSVGGWSQVGQTLVSNYPYSHGIISADGLRVALIHDTNEIRIFDMKSDFGAKKRWMNDHHNVIDPGEIMHVYQIQLRFGSSDGFVMLFSNIDTNMVTAFHQVDPDATWIKMGQDIESSSSSSMAISASGKRIAVHMRSPDTSSDGVQDEVHVLDFDAAQNKWRLVGNAIESQSQAEDHMFGYSINMSSDGNLLLIGLNDPSCLLYSSSSILQPNAFDIETCTASAGASFKLYIYQPNNNKFVSNASREGTEDSNRMSDSILHGLHYSFNSGNGALLSMTSGYNLDDKVLFIDVYDLDALFYTKCDADNPEWIGDGECHDIPPYNSKACGFDGGDCLPTSVEGYPGCFVYEPWWIGNGICSDRPPYNTDVCGFDGGDCLPIPVDGYPSCFLAPSYHDFIGNGECYNYSPYNTAACGFDGGDCIPEPVIGYPDCLLLSQDHGKIGDATCHNYPPYNTEFCQFDGDDCMSKSVDGYPNCYVHTLDAIGDGTCWDWPPYNTPECGYDGGDCAPGNSTIPAGEYPECFVHNPGWIGDGNCFDWPPYNTPECGFDGGDCVYQPVEDYPDCFVLYPGSIGNGHCQDSPPYNTESCGFDGGDCVPSKVDGFPGCFLLSNFHKNIGDGTCSDYPPYNTEACGFDGGDCVPTEVDGYPGCLLLPQFHENIGDGTCSDYSPYNTELCGLDGGDCLPTPVDGYPNCLILPKFHETISDRICHDYPPYNTEECGFDGGDCTPSPVDGYPSCILLPQHHEKIGDGRCNDNPTYNNEACGFDGGDCIPSPVDGYPSCLLLLQYHGFVGDTICHEVAPLSTEACGFDGGDCIPTPVDGYPDCLLVPQYHTKIGDSTCSDYPPYNSQACGFDGGDCNLNSVEGYPDCFVNDPDEIGDGSCWDSPPYNGPECGFDGGDCTGNGKAADGYPECFVHRPDWIGTGEYCEDYPPYDTPECGFDGGDCKYQAVEGYPDCFVRYPGSIGNGYCHDSPPYNTAACGFDGGDCI